MCFGTEPAVAPCLGPCRYCNTMGLIGGGTSLAARAAVMHTTDHAGISLRNLSSKQKQDKLLPHADGDNKTSTPGQ